MTVKKNIKIIMAGLSFIFAAYIIMQLFMPSKIGSSIQLEVEIPQGATYKQAINILYKNNLIRDKNLFILLGKLTGLDRKIKYGYYSFLGKMSPFQVFRVLKSGKIIEYEVTIVEGDSLMEISQKLASAKIMPQDKLDQFAKDDGFLESLNIDAPSLEGYIYPQTYKIPKGTSPGTVLKFMVEKMRNEYSEELRKRAKKLKWHENKVLTLASIIEKEAVTDAERPIISAVYHNRLKKRMPLQADPTAVYGVKSSRLKITKSDLRKKTPYNTYIIRGLPPGPIASPGIKSIKAALYPADVPYLYFVSNRDGTHFFSRTLSEHRAAIKRIKAKKSAKLKEDSDSITAAEAEKG